MSARWVLKLLTIDQNRARGRVSRIDLCPPFMTVVKILIHFNTLRPNNNSNNELLAKSLHLKKKKIVPSAEKGMATIFGIVKV